MSHVIAHGNPEVFDLTGWVGIKLATDILESGPAKVYRLALLQQVRTKLVPGERVLYSEEDLKKIAGRKGSK